MGETEVRRLVWILSKVPAGEKQVKHGGHEMEKMSGCKNHWELDLAANWRQGCEGVVKGKSWEPSDSFNNNINNNKGGIVNEFVPIVLDLRCWQNI